MREPTYDLFKGSSRQNAIWIGTVEGLQAATDRMRCLALAAPNDYFLSREGKVVTSIQNPDDTFGLEMASAWEIAIVSSDPEHIGSVAAILKKQGLDCICTSTLGQYTKALSKRAIGLAFCDPNLSDGDFRDVISAARSGVSKARVVVTSRLGDWPEFLDAIRAGAFDLISMPCRSKDVEWMVIQAKRDNRKMSKQLMSPTEQSRARGAA